MLLEHKTIDGTKLCCDVKMLPKYKMYNQGHPSRFMIDPHTKSKILVAFFNENHNLTYGLYANLLSYFVKGNLT